MSFDEVRAAALALPVEDQRKLAKELRDRAGMDDTPLSAAQIEELDRRWKRHEADPGAAIPGDEFFRRLDAKYGR